MSREKTKAELERELSQLKEAYRLRVIERDHAREVQDALENENKRLAGIISEALSEKRKAAQADLAEVQSGEQASAELRKENAEMQKEIDRLKEAYDGAARRNDELQNEVNKLQQRWMDEFNPEDEMLGRKVLEWQEINVVLAKHNIENSMVLDAELDMLKEYRRVVCNHGITNGQGELDNRLENLEELVKVCTDHGIKSWFDLQKRLDEIEDLRCKSCPEEYMKVFSKYGIDSAEKLDSTLEKWFKVRQCSIALRNDAPYLGSIADFIKELA